MNTQPITLNRWGYAEANPIYFVDPSGYYGKRIHHDLSAEIAKNYGINSCHGLVCALVDQIAEIIANGNQSVDEGSLQANPFGGHPELHFQDHPIAERNAEAAIRANEPFLLGAALHQVQDWYSHWNEGYRWPDSLGHGIDSVAAGCIGIGDCRRPWQIIAQFYITHPFVKSQLSQMYPGVNLNNITSDKLIDLYLYTFTKPGDDERGPLGYGYDTDYYFGFTARDENMKAETIDWISSFFFKLDPCYAQKYIPGYIQPEENSVLNYLITGEY